MLTETRTFVRLGTISLLGLAFYYAHLFLGMVGNAWVFKFLAVAFLLTAVPLPIIAWNNRRFLPEWAKSSKKLIAMGAMLILVHHFLMTFIFVMFLPTGQIF